MSERRGGRVLTRLLALTALAAVSAVALQWVVIERMSPAIGMLLSRVPPGLGAPAEGAGSGSAPVAASASVSASASASVSASASASASGARSATAPRIESVRALGAAASASAQRDAMPRVTRAEIEDAIEHKLDGASAKLVRDAEGAPIGLSIQRPGRLARLGVATGDVLYAANGLRIRTADEGLAALSQLDKATRVVVTFRRGEGTYAIAVDVAP
jgi:S1-C subfamily serine protease